MTLASNQIHQGDCLDLMMEIEDQSVDLILTDLPYSKTACSWDVAIPLEPFWIQCKRVVKPNGAVVLTAVQPFASLLIASNPKWFKYEWIWKKTRPTGFFTVKKQPMRIHENVLVFYQSQPTYNPQKVKADEKRIDRRKTLNPTFSPYLGVKKERVPDDGMRFPTTVQEFASVSRKGQHSAEKPVALFEFLIRTYTNEGDLVLDCCAGSGTTGVAALNLNRRFILIEKFDCEQAERRLKDATP